MRREDRKAAVPRLDWGVGSSQKPELWYMASLPGFSASCVLSLLWTTYRLRVPSIVWSSRPLRWMVRLGSVISMDVSDVCRSRPIALVDLVKALPLRSEAGVSWDL